MGDEQAAQFLRERDEARAELEALRAEVRRALRFSRSRGPDRDYVVQYGSGIKPSEVPLIAALLREGKGTS